MKLAEYPAPEVVPDTEAELQAFREQYRVVRRKARVLAAEAEGLVANDGTPAFAPGEIVYRAMFANTQSAVWNLMGLATKLSPEARAVVEAGIHMPLFDSQGAITQWWRDLWLGPEVKEASRIRRLNDKSRI